LNPHNGTRIVSFQVSVDSYSVFSNYSDLLLNRVMCEAAYVSAYWIEYLGKCSVLGVPVLLVQAVAPARHKNRQAFRCELG
jgi:hypothetical protein